jgi:hypothetical protein
MKQQKLILKDIIKKIKFSRLTIEEQILFLLKEERQNQTIHKVISFKLNQYNFYDVIVDMENNFFDTKILHTKSTLPYPLAKYNKLTNKEQFEWRINNV